MADQETGHGGSVNEREEVRLRPSRPNSPLSVNTAVMSLRRISPHSGVRMGLGADELKCTTFSHSRGTKMIENARPRTFAGTPTVWRSIIIALSVGFIGFLCLVHAVTPVARAHYAARLPRAHPVAEESESCRSLKMTCNLTFGEQWNSKPG